MEKDKCNHWRHSVGGRGGARPFSSRIQPDVNGEESRMFACAAAEWVGSALRKLSSAHLLYAKKIEVIMIRMVFCTCGTPHATWQREGSRRQQRPSAAPFPSPPPRRRCPRGCRRLLSVSSHQDGLSLGPPVRLWVKRQSASCDTAARWG